MHIVIATGLYPPDVGGPATFATGFEEGLKRIGVPFTTVPFSAVRTSPKFIRHIIYFFYVFRSIQADSVVLALDPISVGIPALLAARVRRAPLFLRIGGDYAWEQATLRFGFKGLPEEFSGSTSLPLFVRLLVWLQSFVARRAKKVLVQSSYLAGLVERWGVARTHISIVPSGVSVPDLPSREELRASLGWGNEPVVISAGRLVPWKGFAAVIDAAGVVARTYPNMRLLIAGDGPDEHLLRIRAQSSPVRVEMIGRTPREVLLRYIRASDVFVLNTRYEGLSHQILESFAVGTPVVTTTAGGNRDIAEHKKTALTVPWNDTGALAEAIMALLRDTKMHSTLREGALSLVRTYSHERQFRETCSALGIVV